jgi:hypothetical protein
MPPPPTLSQKLVLALVLIVSLAALAFAVLAPGFTLDNGLVYRGF